MRRFVFITGTGRCGSKLIHGLLDGSPGLNIIPGAVSNLFAESLSYNGFSNNVYYINSKRTLANIINAFKSAKSIHQKSNFEKITRLLRKRFAKKNCISLNEYIDIITNTLFPNKKQTVINIENENIIGLLQTFPNSKVIHMLRNPLTQINGRYLFRYNAPNNYDGMEFSSSFYRNYNSFKNAYLMKNDKRVLIIKMENLKKNTEININKTCKFLSINFNKINLIVTEFGKKIYNELHNYNQDLYAMGYLPGDQNLVNDKGIKKTTHDFSCLTPNDLYIVSEIKYVKKFYKLRKFNKSKNSFFIFFLRHLGFIGKKRSKTFNPYKLIKYSIFSIYLFFLDKHLKNIFLKFENI